MKAVRDPQGAEASALAAVWPLPGRHVLEIGCGSGQLTWQYAGLPRRVVGIDPDAVGLRQAKVDRPASVANVFMLQAVAEALPFLPRVFDVVLFSSSF